MALWIFLTPGWAQEKSDAQRETISRTNEELNQSSAEQDLCPNVAVLREKISRCIAQAKYESAFWGIKIISLTNGKTLFEHNSQKLFSPASSTKLFTVAAALDRFGPDYRMKTSLLSTTKPKDGVLPGDVIIYGRGDPTINAKLHDGDLLRALEPLVNVLRQSGVRQINGDLIGDQSFFHGPEFGSGWAWDDLEYYYGAEISALTINDNVLSATVIPNDTVGKACVIRLNPPTAYLSISNRTKTLAAGEERNLSFFRPLNENIVYINGGLAVGATNVAEEVTVHNPAALFAAFFRQALERGGIKVGGRVRTLNWLERQTAPLDLSAAIELGSVESLPLEAVVREIQKISQNLYADLLLGHLGEVCRRAKEKPETTSEELGVGELKSFLTEAGIGADEYFFEEGSGLSRDTLATPNAIVQLLAFMRRHKHADIYFEALPIAGVDGTLRNRMKGTAASGKVRAKTGSLRWASSLCGYVTTAAGEPLAFSLMLNRYDPAPGSSGREDLDAIAALLAGLTAKSD